MRLYTILHRRMVKHLHNRTHIKVRILRIPMRNPIRLIHTSDIHLADGGSDGYSALAAVVDLGNSLQSDALLIAGDLFDHSRVKDEEVANFLNEVRRFRGPVIVLPGNHDPYDSSSIYLRPSFKSAPYNLNLLTQPDNGPVVFNELGLEVWGRPTVNHDPSFQPLHQVPPRAGDCWYVVLAHGHLVERLGGAPSSPILRSEIADAPCDYIALGHWDHFRDVSEGSVPAFYSGSPRRHAGHGSVVLVELCQDGVSIERHSLVY